MSNEIQYSPELSAPERLHQVVPGILQGGNGLFLQVNPAN